MTKRCLAGLVSICLSQMALASVITDARSAGSGGIGIASGDYTHSNLNPALLTNFQNDDAYLKLGIAAHEKGATDTINKIDSFATLADVFSDNPNQENAEKLIYSLDTLDYAPLDVSAGAGINLYIPSKIISFGISIDTEILANGSIYIDPADKDTINDAINDAINGANFSKTDYSSQFNFDPEKSLKSTASIRAAALSEVKLSFARKISIPKMEDISIGISPKFQRVDTLIYKDSIYSFEPQNYDKKDIKNNNGFNLDIGLQSTFGPVQLGFVGKNLISKKINILNKYSNTNEIWNIKPLYSAGVAVRYWKMILGTNIDLNKDESFVLKNTQDNFMLARQWARIGLEIDIVKQVQFRAGYKKDLANNYDDQITAGLGISPFDVLTIDLAGQYSTEDDFSAAFQLGFKF